MSVVRVDLYSCEFCPTTAIASAAGVVPAGWKVLPQARHACPRCVSGRSDPKGWNAEGRRG